MTNQQYLKVATAAANAGGKIFKQYFGKAIGIEAKNQNPNDLVTDVDKNIEKLIRSQIRKYFPTHKIIGEEFKADKINKNDLIWIIDPIDGTTNYIYGIPFCCISIALWDKNGPLVAVVYSPILDKFYSAVRGQGAKLNGKKIRVSKTNKLIKAMGTIGWGKEMVEAKMIFSKLVMRCFKLRVFATGAWQICMTASSNVDFFASNRENIWDFAAAVLIVKEAGGKVTDLNGKNISLKTDSIIASNGKLHNQLLNKLKSPA